MKNRWIGALLLAGLVSNNLHASMPKAINLGILGGENAEAQIGNNQCVVEFMQEELGVKTNIRNSSDYNSVIQGLLGKKIDLVINMSPKAFAEVYLNGPEAIDIIGLIADNTDNSRGYHSVVIVKADSPYQNIDDLRGHSFAFADPNSTSGYLIPNNQLERQVGGTMDNRFNGFFESLRFSGGHEQNIVGVINGQFDAAVSASSMVGDRASGYSAGALHRYAKHDPEVMDKIRIIWQSPLIANGSTIVSNDLEPEFKAKLVAAVKKLDKEDNACFSKAAGGLRHLAETSIEEYQSVIDLVYATKFIQR
ncbi:phosphonate ABC transporter substrate-binding protein [Vibrio mediterranei]|uniref:phosphonate ABC transporter substrate-binding protein n=1 Tax=Vibrio mediterranei TaxID=689 RepID=UPI0022846A25|nr:phosphonate ABC transporter substrate-binding protein [Vibrio mediterranei]MCY9854437.1 phosphonate ABC transporter substrate-binding protein [Vibrio mediterranei]